MCFDTDDGYPEFQDTSYPKARKAHRCDCCGKQMPIGVQYCRSSGKFDGEFYDVKVCNLCEQNRYLIVAHELAEGCDWSEAWPQVDDQRQWLFDHPTFKRATVVRDLEECRRELDAVPRLDLKKWGR